MASNSTKKTSKENNTAEQKTATDPVIEERAGSASEPVEEEKPTPLEGPAAKPRREEKVDEAQYVTVRNGFHGALVYISSRTGERFNWPEYGDEQEMELRELKGAKSSQKAFFTENWFLLDDWVIQYLGVEAYYKHSADRHELDHLLKAAPDKIASEIAQMSHGQREAITYRAKEMIKSGEIDSLRTITALENALGVELIEK